MKNKLFSAIFFALLWTATCVAQSTNNLIFGENIHGAQLSISLTNNIISVGSEITIFIDIRNLSTNKIHLGDFIVSLTSDAGKVYQLSDVEFTKSNPFLMAPFTLLGIGTNDLTAFQNQLIQMNIDIYNDLAWQFEAYNNAGLKALNIIYVGETNAFLDSTNIVAWREIDDGIGIWPPWISPNGLS